MAIPADRNNPSPMLKKTLWHLCEEDPCPDETSLMDRPMATTEPEFDDDDEDDEDDIFYSDDDDGPGDDLEDELDDDDDVMDI